MISHNSIQVCPGSEGSLVELPPDLPTGESLGAWVCANLTVPAVSDTLDSIGLRHQAMHHRLRPLDSGNCTFAGRARTLQWIYTDGLVETDAYEIEIEAMDSLLPGDVVIHSSDSRFVNAPWGELMSTAARVRGAVGCVCDSLIRDCRRIHRMGFPVFHAGVRPVDSNGRAKVTAFDVPVRCGEVSVRPGDLVFADLDGVVVIPSEVEERVLAGALERIKKEHSARSELLKGVSLKHVFERHRVL